MSTLNTVLSGDYTGIVFLAGKKKGLYIAGPFGRGEKIFLTKKNVASYEVISDETKTSVVGAATTGLVGAALFGGIGAVVGAAAGSKEHSYTVAIDFLDGKKCVIEIDAYNYEVLVNTCK